MRRPLSLAAYLALSRPKDGVARDTAPTERPPGQIVWLHSGAAADAHALQALAMRLSQIAPDAGFLKTGQWSATETGLRDLPDENLNAARAFLSHWSPDLCIWTGHELRPALLEAAFEGQMPSLLVNADLGPYHTPGPRWLPDAAPAALARFTKIFCTSRDAERMLRRQGLEAGRVVRAGTLSAAAPPLECAPELHEEVAGILGGRPVWLAARLRSGEMRAIFDAHIAAGRLAPRLLLVVVPETPEDWETAKAIAGESGLRSCLWDAGEMPDELTELVLCENPEELGLWYRIAPVSFLGGSLQAGAGGTNPLEAAALGSAILYGPNVGKHLGTYTKLVDAGAARIVRDAHSLSAAVSQIIAPDRAAAMAHAGWDVVTQGAKTEDLIIEEISALLDGTGQRREAE